MLGQKNARPDTLSQDTVVAFRHGYITVSHPDHGTLVIRNSSHHYGRDLLKHPAYWMKTPLSEDWVADFKPSDDNKELHSILDVELYNKASHKVDDIQFLIDQVDSVRDDYRHWKLNMDAVNDTGEYVGHLRKDGTGLKPSLRKFLDAAMTAQSINKGETPLRLALASKTMPIWAQKDYSSFELSPANVRAIEVLIQSDGEKVAPNLQAFLSSCYEHGDYAELVITD